MKTVTCTNAKLEVVDQPTPEPGKGQLLIEVLRCGICGSDLHARHHCDELADVMVESGYDAFMRSNQSVVFGHEFCGEVLDYGPGTRKAPRRGTRVVALPLLRRGKEVHGIGLSAMAPGAYAEQLLVEQSLTLPVPNGLTPEVAALTEPMAVGWHAVRRGEVGKGDVAIVIGCGPIGRAVGPPPPPAPSPRAGARLRPPAEPTPPSIPRRTPPTRPTRAANTCKASSTRSTWRSARSKSCSGCGCRGGTFGAPPKPPAPRRPNIPSSSNVSASLALSTASSRARRCSRASSWSASAWARTTFAPRWRSTKRPTFGSSSATPRSSSATRRTCSR